MVDLTKARERHYALIAGVKVDVLIARINAPLARAWWLRISWYGNAIAGGSYANYRS